MSHRLKHRHAALLRRAKKSRVIKSDLVDGKPNPAYVLAREVLDLKPRKTKFRLKAKPKRKGVVAREIRAVPWW